MKRTRAFLLALYIFISGMLAACNNTAEINNEVEETEVVAVHSPTKETEDIINEIKQTIEETTEPIETFPKKEIELILDEIALLTIGGKYGTGEERRINLTNLGYNYDVISNRVNEIMNGASYTIPDRNTYIYNFGYVNKQVDVYDEFGNREGSLSAYQKFIITDKEVNDMILVHFQNQTFYLKKNDIKKLGDTHLEVDISEQKVYMYIDGIFVHEANLISGYPGKGTTPGTNLGHTQIYSISYNVTFTPEKQSDIFLLFNWDGEGFHDASWRDDWEFEDKERYLTHGSDGCCNMMEEDISVLEENCYLGMSVLTHK